jgi:PBP1b-binding outer membrane lipoprotein LpoB
MKKRVSSVLAAVVLLAGVSVASAANTHSENATATATATADVLNLNRINQKVAWIDLSEATNESTFSSLKTAAVGSVVPNMVTIRAVTKKTASDVPALRSYDFVIVQGRLLIVNPSDRKIAEVIEPGYFFA